MGCSDSAKIMSTLKDFQRKTVEYVFKRFYEDDPPATRFLVADEVGLGKTLVARAVIAKTIEHLRAVKKRIDIIYICSNGAIAAQNVNRLRLLGMKEIELPRRLTLLPKQLKGLSSKGINLLSLTPGTSFDLKNSSGVAEERVTLFRLLQAEPWVDSKGLKKLLRCGVSPSNWKDLTKGRKLGVDRTIALKFRDMVQGDVELQEAISSTSTRFRKYRKRIPADDHRMRLGIVGELRERLARLCIQTLEPDLVILDEFQRFRNLLHADDVAAQLARALFEYPKTRVLLLSATPYKPLTLDHEREEDHYSEFLETLKFLFNDPDPVELIRADIPRFRRQLLSYPSTSPKQILETQNNLETRLKKVMCRTERVSATADQNSMLKELHLEATLSATDLQNAAGLDRIALVLGSHDIVEYWKSSPYPLSFLKDYDLRKKLDEVRNDPPADLLEVMESSQIQLLRRSQILKYRRIDPGNARMRSLFSEVLDGGMWQLLWMPASMPYTTPAGPYAGIENASKYLVFSSWNLVPEAISSLCSYEAERRMLGGLGRGIRHEDLSDQVSQLLTFKVESNRGPAGMPTLALLYPSPALATLVDPLRIALNAARREGLTFEEALAVAEKILLKRLKPFLPSRGDHGGPSDRRWYWASPALLDSLLFPNVRQWCLDRTGWLSIQNREGERGFGEHVSHFADVLGNRLMPPLGRPPEDLGRVLASLALAGPGVCALRSLLRISRPPNPADKVLLSAAARVSDGFRSLFNLPETIGLLRGIGEEDHYWRLVLNYCLEGNIQAVLDEHVHMLQESLGLTEERQDTRVTRTSSALTEALSILPSQVTLDLVSAVPRESRIKIDPYRSRCRFALRLGTTRKEKDQTILRMDTVRNAFNSPFRPFVLATTSIGQEGLDFHTWCHVVLHWNLPSNPVDLEQREGRVHRYKGYAVRKNIAERYGLAMLSRRWDKKGDPWNCLFELAKQDRPEGINDLVPFWIFGVEGGACVERRVPMLPFSREQWQLNHLKKELALYRLAFGQPRQEDLLMYLSEQLSPDEASKIVGDWRITLAP